MGQSRFPTHVDLLAVVITLIRGRNRGPKLVPLSHFGPLLWVIHVIRYRFSQARENDGDELKYWISVTVVTDRCSSY